MILSEILPNKSIPCSAKKSLKHPDEPAFNKTPDGAFMMFLSAAKRPAHENITFFVEYIITNISAFVKSFYEKL